MRRDWIANKGEGLRLLFGDVDVAHACSPARGNWRQCCPNAACTVFEPCGMANRREAMRLAFGRAVDLHYRLENCEVIVSLDDDLLGPGSAAGACTRAAWASGRGEASPGRPAHSPPRRREHAESDRHGCGEPAVRSMPRACRRSRRRSPRNSASIAASSRIWRDERTRLGRSGRARIARSTRANRCSPSARICRPPFRRRRPSSTSGSAMSATTLWYSDPVAFAPDNAGTLGELARDIDGGAVETLIILDANPAYAAPGKLGFAELIARVRNTIHVGLHPRRNRDALCEWHLPLAHALESWSDARAIDGTATIIQPLVAPFYSVRTAASDGRHAARRDRSRGRRAGARDMAAIVRRRFRSALARSRCMTALWPIRLRRRSR